MEKTLFISSLLLSLNSYASSLVCTGTVAYHGNNQLMIKLSSMNTPVSSCNPEKIDSSRCGRKNNGARDLQISICDIIES